MKISDSDGFAPIEVLLLLIIIAIVAFTGLYVFQARHNATKSLDTASQAAASQTAVANAPTVTNYYDCWTVPHPQISDSTNACTYQGKTYALPDSFSTDMIRGYEKVPESARQTVLDLAKSTYAACSAPQLQHRLPATIDIYNANENFVYLGVDCDSGHREILHNSSGTWTSILTSQAGVPCSLVKQYDIPQSILNVKGEDSSCVNM